MRAVTKPHQTLMFSATMEAGVEQVAREFLRNPERVTVGSVTAPPSTIRQSIYPVKTESKGPMLLELLGSAEVESAIVFTRTKSRADRVAKLLVRSGIMAVAIHGDRSQSQRNAALAGFRRGTYRVMVATDIAARGLDIQDVSHVINFDLPDVPDTYIHRIGRTARMGKAGAALTLVAPDERQALAEIERLLGRKLERARVAGFELPELGSAKSSTGPRPVVYNRRPQNRRRAG